MRNPFPAHNTPRGALLDFLIGIALLVAFLNYV